MIDVKTLLLDHLQYTHEREAWHPPLGIAVKGLTAAQAAWKSSPERHSIWQIVRHIIHWKRGVLQSWGGDPPDLEQLNRDDWGEVTGDQKSWEADLKILDDLHAEAQRRLQAESNDGLGREIKAYQQSHQKTVLGRRLLWVFTHDAYHAGQIQYLRALQGIPADRFFTAVTDGNLARTQAALAQYPDLLNTYSRDGWTGLQLAAYYGRTEVVRFLLARGASTAAVSQNFMANTALHGAVAGRHAAVVSLLVERGADIKAADASGNTPLHTAAHEGIAEIVELLLARGANVNARRKDGVTPLGVAAKEGHTKIAELLRARGAVE